MVMAIRRCPYCKAIIDGVAEYCSNCGTQLLFPEDESKEEEIPGDKIVEEEKEEETLESKGEEEEKEEPSPESEEEEGEEEKEEVEVTPPEAEPEEKEEIEVTSPSPEKDTDIQEAEALRMREARELVKKETERLWASVGTGVGKKTTTVDLEIPSSHDEKKGEITEALEKKYSKEREEEIKTEGEPLPEIEIKEETGEPPSLKAPEEEEALESEEELQVEEEKKEVEVTPIPQREEIDLRSIRLRRTPDTEKREKEDVDRFVESVKEERGKEDEPPEEEISLPDEGEEEKREEKEIAPPQKEEIDLRSIRLRKTPDTEEREKVEIERFVESIKKERERVQEYLTPDEEVPLPKEIGEAETAEIKEKIPPWAEKIKEEPPQELEDKEEKKEIEEPAGLGEELQEEEKKTPEEEPLPPTEELPLEEEKPPPSTEEPPSLEEPVPKEEKPPTPAKELPPEEEPPPPAEEPPPPAAKPLTSARVIGIPEEVDQKVPFTREIREKRKRAKRRRRSRFYAWSKSRVFDFVFIAAFCLICLGLASRLMQVSLFSLISATGAPILVFYFVLLLFYFGFFILFLGETPGDRLFPRD